MPAIEITPAAVVKVPHWVSLNLSNNPGTVDGKVEFHISGNVGVANIEFLEIDGVKTQLLKTGTSFAAYQNHEQISTMLNEQVTRGDGTTLTVLELLDKILSTYATENPPPVAPSSPNPPQP